MEKSGQLVWVRERLEFVSTDEEYAELTAQVMRMTRNWVQYGVFGFTVFCIVFGALEAMLGR